MKVNEVTIINKMFVEDGLIDLSSKDIISGYVSDTGLTLSVVVPKSIAGTVVRKLKIDYNNIDYKEGKVLTNNLKDVTLLETPTDNTTTCDLSPVLQLPAFPQSSITEQFYTLEYFTAEANTVDTNYGTKRLSAPYRISGDTNNFLHNTTDGWYSFYIADIPIWVGQSSYSAGDIVYYDVDAMYRIATVNTNESIEHTDWAAPTSNDWKVCFENIPSSTATTIYKVTAEVLITHNIKYSYILDGLRKLATHKESANTGKKMLIHACAMREAAIAYMEMGDPINAKAMIDKIPIEVHTVTKTSAITSTYRI